MITLRKPKDIGLSADESGRILQCAVFRETHFATRNKSMTTIRHGAYGNSVFQITVHFPHLVLEAKFKRFSLFYYDIDYTAQTTYFTYIFVSDKV